MNSSNSGHAPHSPLPVHGDGIDRPFELPGGDRWGYAKDKACIIATDAPCQGSAVPLDGVAMEHEYVEWRIKKELLAAGEDRTAVDKVNWKLLKRCVINDGANCYDHLVFNVFGYLRAEPPQLNVRPPSAMVLERDEATGGGGRRRHMIRYQREFWFEIDSRTAPPQANK